MIKILFICHGQESECEPLGGPLAAEMRQNRGQERQRVTTDFTTTEERK